MDGKNVFLLIGAGVLAVSLTSCIKYHELATSEFPQGQRCDDKQAVCAAYSRQAPVYKEFETQAWFDLLWLSDSVRTAYVDVYCSKRGWSADKKEEMLKRQLEENRHWLSFYVLAEVPDRTYAALNDPNALWTFSALVDNNEKIVPEPIKDVDLEPEFQLLFGSKFNSLKTAYILKFPITPDIADALSKGQFKKVQLVIQSIHKKIDVVWDKKSLVQTKKVVRDEDFYWG